MRPVARFLRLSAQATCGKRDICPLRGIPLRIPGGIVSAMSAGAM